MDSLFTFLTNLLTTAPWLIVPVLGVAGIYAYPALRKWQKENSTVADEGEAIRKAGEAIREELKGMLDKAQVRVEGMENSLDEARLDVSRMHAENIELRTDMTRLRSEMKSLFRTARAMRIAMQKAVTDNDVLPLRIWLDLNPEDEELPATVATRKLPPPEDDK